MCIPLTPVLLLKIMVKIEVSLQCFIESVSLRAIGKPTSGPELRSLKPLYFKSPKRADFGSA